MTDEFFEFGIGENDETIGTKIQRWSAEKRTYRLGFSLWGDALDKTDLDDVLKTMLKLMTQDEDAEEAPSPRFIGANRHYVPGVGYFLAKGPEYEQLATNHGGKPAQTYAATIIIVWPSDTKGVVTKSSLSRLPEIFPWVFSKDKYQDISGAHRQFPFGEHDLMAECKDTQYQKMSFLPAKTCLLRQMIERALGDEILEAEFGKAADPEKKRKPDQRSREVLQHIIDISRECKTKLRDFIARDMSLKQIKEKLGQADNSPVSGGGGNAPAANEEIDGLLEDILED